jgi:hypothetical protein
MSLTYQIGNIKLTQQAFIVFLAGSSLSVFLFLASIALGSQATTKLAGIIISLILFGFTCYYTYITNCVIVGNCNALAWVLTIMYMLVFVIQGYQIYIKLNLMPTMKKGKT